MTNSKHWASQKFILASQSPRRKDIFTMIGLTFQVQSSDYEETPIPDASPAELVKIHAREKAKDVAKNFSEELVVGADTIVVINNKILEKPKNHDDAINMLQKLSGKTHEVMTGYAVVNSANQKFLSGVATTKVTFFPLSEEMIRHYLDNYQYMDKAGSYAIQDYSSIFVEKIDGCFYNVVGFPIAEFYKFLNDNLHKII